MTRTFSKIHGLASLRIGWAYGSAHVIDALNRVRGPFNLNGAAQAAGVASLDDAAHIEGAIAHNARWLPWLAEQIAALGVEVTPSVGNFLLLTFPKESGRSAAAADAFLSARGFILRAVAAYGLPDSLRLTVGGEEANQGRGRCARRVHARQRWLTGSGSRSPSRSSKSWRSSASG